MNIQRDLIYKERNRLINGERDLRDVLSEMIDEYIETILSENIKTREELFHYLVTNISFNIRELPLDLVIEDEQELRNFLIQIINNELNDKKTLLEPHDLYDQFLRVSMLKAIDDNWVEQVDYLQQLMMAIGGQTASQTNPIVEYYREAYMGFETMKEQIRSDMVRNILMGLVQMGPKGEIVTHFP